MNKKLVANTPRKLGQFLPEYLSAVKIGNVPNIDETIKGIGYLSAGVLQEYSIQELSAIMRIIEFASFNSPADRIKAHKLSARNVDPHLLMVDKLDITNDRNLAAITSSWLHYKNVQDNTVIFAIEKGMFIGFIELCESSKAIAKIAIIPAAQGKRTGDELLKLAIKMFLKLGINNPHISASPGAEKFYDRFFSETKTITEGNKTYNITTKSTQINLLNGKTPNTTYYLTIN